MFKSTKNNHTYYHKWHAFPSKRPSSLNWGIKVFFFFLCFLMIENQQKVKETISVRIYHHQHHHNTSSIDSAWQAAEWGPISLLLVRMCWSYLLIVWQGFCYQCVSYSKGVANWFNVYLVLDERIQWLQIDGLSVCCKLQVLVAVT